MMNQKTITNKLYAEFSFTNHSLYVLYYKKGAFVHSDSFKKKRKKKTRKCNSKKGEQMIS